MQRPNDADNRLTGVDVGNTGNAPAIQYAYDPAGLRSSMADPTGTTTYAHDASGRLTGVAAPATGQVSYAYDPSNQLATLTYPSGHQVGYAYTVRGQLASVTDWQSHQTAYTYDDAGRLAQIAVPNGVTSSLTYDVADRLTGVVHAKGGTNLEAIAYQLDPAGNRTQMQDSAGTTTWAYDALDRLTGASYPNGDQVSYQLDPVGNRTSLTVNGATTTSTYDAADELTASGGTAYTYDANGNELTATNGGVTTTYTYDPLNRLTGIAGPATASYAYNGDGLRVAKTVGGATTSYTWDPTGIGRVLGDGNEYLWGTGLIGQVNAAGAATYAHADGLGSVRLLTDATGAVAGREQYDAYGAPRGQTGMQLPFTYTGEQQDPESGLVYLRARYMDPASGRFLTRDTFPGIPTNPGSMHRYAYAQDRPMFYVDPTGRVVFFVHGVGDDPQPADSAAFSRGLSRATGQAVVDKNYFCNAFTPQCIGGSLIHAAATSLLPFTDSDANDLASQIRAYHHDHPGEPINLVGYSGGASTVMNAAAVAGVHICTIVTIGGYYQRGKSDNVGRWADIVGGMDFITLLEQNSLVLPDAMAVTDDDHFSYFSDGGGQAGSRGLANTVRLTAEAITNPRPPDKWDWLRSLLGGLR